MVSKGEFRRLLLALAIVILSFSVQAQRLTIPEAVARGSVSSVATVPSGQLPTVADLLRAADIVVMGTIGEARSYLSPDQRDVYTDYQLSDRTYLFQSQVTTTPTPGVVPSVTVTQLGGTLLVNGTRFTHKEAALPPLQTGTRALFILRRVGDKYFIAGKFLGVFGITEDRLAPLMAREDFAPEYRNVRLSDAMDSITAVLRSRAGGPTR